MRPVAATARRLSSTCFSIGDPFKFLRLTDVWDGTSWNTETTPNQVSTDGTNGSLAGGVSCPTTGVYSAVGEFSPSPAPHPGITLAERRNGAVWQIQSTPNPYPVGGFNGTHNSPFAGVSCATVNDCTAVGNYDSGNASDGFLTLAERWNGTSWSVQ